MIEELVYPAIFEEEADGYVVRFPDLKGCLTQGDDYKEALYMANDALVTYLAFHYKSGFEHLPKASTLHSLKLEKGECVALIHADIKDIANCASNKTVKKSVSIPSWLNTIALKKHINFSKLLQEALIKEIEKKKGKI